jgi:hypothetical protein
MYLSFVKVLLKIMDSSVKNIEDVGMYIQQYLSWGLDFAQLRDELYCQIIKQMTWSKEDEPKGGDRILIIGWEMLALSTGTFPPSKVSKEKQRFNR